MTKPSLIIDLTPEYPWLKRPSQEKRQIMATLLDEAYDRNPTPFHASDRSVIMELMSRGAWNVVRVKLELGQAVLPKEEVELLLAQMTLLE